MIQWKWKSSGRIAWSTQSSKYPSRLDEHLEDHVNREKELNQHLIDSQREEYEDCVYSLVDYYVVGVLQLQAKYIGERKLRSNLISFQFSILRTFIIL